MSDAAVPITWDLLSDPDAVGTVCRLGLILSLLLVPAAWRWKSRGDSKLALKVFTVWVVAPVLLLGVLAGGLAFWGLVAVVMIQALREWCSLVRMPGAYAAVLVGYSLLALVVVALLPAVSVFVLPFTAFLPATLWPILSGHVSGAFHGVGGVLLGYVYIGFPMAILVSSRAEPWGTAFLVLIGTATALADAAAYFVGNWLRGPLLAHSVSPNKTWSGLAGGMGGAAAGLSVHWWFISPAAWGMGTFTTLAATTGIGAAWGDLIESVVKRNFMVKDAGDVLPGFGGMLDRFDSFLLSIPLSYMAVVGVYR